MKGAGRLSVQAEPTMTTALCEFGVGLRCCWKTVKAGASHCRTTRQASWICDVFGTRTFRDFKTEKLGDTAIMQSRRNESIRGQRIAICVQALLVAALVVLGSGHSGWAHGGMGGGVAASQAAQAGLAGCSNNHGKPLYDCVANVLDRLS